MASFLKGVDSAKPLQSFKKGMVVKGGGTMGLIKGYKYVLECSPGLEFDPKFNPVFTPAEMLCMGVFEGKYLNDCTNEFPKEWFLLAHSMGKLSPLKSDISCNYFGVGSRQPLSVWIENGWSPSKGNSKSKSVGKAKGSRAILADHLKNPDERGWFQWYCRYWLGRRIPDLDAVQISRWRSFARHAGAVKKGCASKDLECRRRERQALLQWSYDPLI
jgi:hypothetical protein